MKIRTLISGSLVVVLATGSVRPAQASEWTSDQRMYASLVFGFNVGAQKRCPGYDNSELWQKAIAFQRTVEPLLTTKEMVVGVMQVESQTESMPTAQFCQTAMNLVKGLSKLGRKP